MAPQSALEPEKIIAIFASWSIEQPPRLIIGHPFLSFFHLFFFFYRRSSTTRRIRNRRLTIWRRISFRNDKFERSSFFFEKPVKRTENETENSYLLKTKIRFNFYCQRFKKLSYKYKYIRLIILCQPAAVSINSTFEFISHSHEISRCKIENVTRKHCYKLRS